MLAWLALPWLAAGPGVASAQPYVPGPEPAFPRLKYADSLVSPNDRCTVANKLNPKVRPVYVNRIPIGFCRGGCPRVFVQDPERYLQGTRCDGTAWSLTR